MIPKSQDLYAFIGRNFLNPSVNEIEEIDGLELLIGEIRGLRQRDIGLELDNFLAVKRRRYFVSLERHYNRVEGRTRSSVVMYPIRGWTYVRLTCGLYACIPLHGRSMLIGNGYVSYKDYRFFLDVSKFPYLPRPEGTKYLGFDILAFQEMDDMGEYAEQMGALIKYLGCRNI